MDSVPIGPPVAFKPIAGGADVGSLLEAARRRRGMSLEDLAAATKIRISFLRAIETKRQDELPAPVYVRGFLRAYAREVGLEPDDVIRGYVEQFEPVVQPVLSPETPIASRSSGRANGRTAVGQWLVIAIVVAGAFAYTRARGAHETPAAAAHPTTAPVRSETGTSGSIEPKTTAAVTGVLHMVVETTGPCWLSATADGKQVMYGLLQAHEQRAFEVHRDAIMRVGDPAAFSFSIDGTPGRSLGRPREAVTAHITTENYRQFLVP